MYTIPYDIASDSDCQKFRMLVCECDVLLIMHKATSQEIWVTVFMKFYMSGYCHRMIFISANRGNTINTSTVGQAYY